MNTFEELEEETCKFIITVASAKYCGLLFKRGVPHLEITS